MTKKGHTNPKTIDTNLKIIKLYSLILIFIISGCDFRTPETWETPTWYLPLYIPLFNDSITLGDLIDTEGSDIQLDTITNSYSIDTSLVMIYGPCPDDALDPLYEDRCCGDSPASDCPDEITRVSIPQEYFAIDGVSIPISMEDMSINIESSNIENISESISVVMSDLIEGEIQSGCVPMNDPDSGESLFEGGSLDLSENATSISPYSQLDDISFDDIDLEINGVNIDGSIQLSIINSLPVAIDNFQILFTDENGDEWVNAQVTNIAGGSGLGESTTILDNSLLPQTINVEPLMSYSVSSNCDAQYPMSDFDEEFSISSQDECFVFFAADILNSACDCLVDFSACTIEINNAQDCSELNTLIEDYSLIWEDGECLVDLGEGILIEEDGQLLITYLFEVTGGSVDASIDMNVEISSIEDNSTIAIPTEQFGGVGFYSAHVQEIDVDCSIYGSELSCIEVDCIWNDDECIEFNKLSFSYTNNLFAPINFYIELFMGGESNSAPIFYNGDIEPLDTISTILTVSSEEQEFEYDFSDHFIGNPDSSINLDNIDYIITTKLNDDVIIEMDTEYSFGLGSGDAGISSLKFDELTLDLEEFESPAINMGDIPAGFAGFELPTLAFNLIFYNTINTDSLTLVLDIRGSSDDADEIVLHAEPVLGYTAAEGEIDTTILSIKSDGVSVIKTDGTTTVYEYGEGNTLYDVFNMDNISVDGQAKLAGRSKIQPNRSVWADMQVSIEPITLVLTDNISFVSEAPINFDPLDVTVTDQIDSNLVEARIDMEIENAMPLGGSISMIISDSDRIPSCLDTLLTGTYPGEQNISLICEEYIDSSYADISSIEVESIEGASWYIKFFDSNDAEVAFFGKFFNLALVLPESIDSLGYVLEPSIYVNPIILTSSGASENGDNNRKLKWLVNDDILYIVPQVILEAHDESDPDDNGWRTLSAENYLKINSTLILEIDVGQITSKKDEKTKNKIGLTVE